MDIVESAQRKFEEARASHEALTADYELRIAALDDTASSEDVQAVLDEFAPKVEASEAELKRTKDQLGKLTNLAEARKAALAAIPTGTEDVDDLEERKAPGTESRIQVGNEPHTYDKENMFGPSYFADLYAFQRRNDRGALDRLARGSQETWVDGTKKGIIFRDKEGRAMSSSDGSGGDFLPPLYFGDLYAEYKRASRVTARLVRNRPLAAVGNTITIPRVTAGTLTAAQQDNQNVETNDATTAIVTIPVCTVAGYNDLSRQIVERSEPGLDQIILEDLLRDYNKRVNSYVVNGTGSSGQPTGFVNQSGTNAITYTSGSPTVYGLYPKVANAVAQITEQVFEPTSSFVCTAARWAWMLSSVDANNRPLVVPNGQGPFNALGLMNDGNASFVDNVVPAGWFMGYTFYVDETLPKTQGAGTNQDIIIGAAWNEHILWEDPAGPRSFQFEGVTSQTAAIRLQVFGYMAFTAGRYPFATSIIQGTGLTAPTF